MKKIKILFLSLIVMLLASTMMVYAESAGENETNSVTTAGSQSTDIKYTQTFSFTVTLPKKITIQSDKTATYWVNVKGDLYGNQSVIVTPDTSINLLETAKGSVTGTVSQPVTKLNAVDINTLNGATTSGTITAEGLSAGEWSSQLNFSIVLNETVLPGLYDAEGNLLCTWEESGIDVGKNYTGSDDTSTTSGYYVLNNEYSETAMVILPDNITGIGNYAFYNCSNLSSVMIPESVTSIGSGAFISCSGLTSITIPDSVISIGLATFNGCSGLTSITIPDSVTSISANTFYNCTGLTSITIPDSVTRIDSNAFSRCSSLSSVTILEGVKYIENYVFSGCTSLTSIAIPDSIISIGPGAFNSCSSLSSVTYKGTAYTSKSALTTALSDNGVTVGSGAFNNTALTN